jgi:hypothetical protein
MSAGPSTRPGDGSDDDHNPQAGAADGLTPRLAWQPPRRVLRKRSTNAVKSRRPGSRVGLPRHRHRRLPQLLPSSRASSCPLREGVALPPAAGRAQLERSLLPSAPRHHAYSPAFERPDHGAAASVALDPPPENPAVERERDATASAVAPRVAHPPTRRLPTPSSAYSRRSPGARLSSQFGHPRRPYRPWGDRIEPSAAAYAPLVTNAGTGRSPRAGTGTA